MALDLEDDLFGGGNSNHLAPSPNKHSRKTPSKLNGVKAQRSSSSLRPASSFAPPMDSDGGDGRHSLAHELAAALMPEPSSGQMLLAEEFGLEFDEGAEGIDEQANGLHSEDSLKQHLNGHTNDFADDELPTFAVESPSDDLSRHFGGSSVPQTPTARRGPPKPSPAKDPMDVLSRDIESTEAFLSHLRRLDMDSNPSTSQLPLEKIASDMIRHMNDTARDREGQVRELMECEREFRKIAGEVGGSDVLSRVDDLPEVEDLVDTTASDIASSSSPTKRKTLETSQPMSRDHSRQSTGDWDMDPDVHRLGDEDNSYDIEPESPSPTKDAFPIPPQVSGPATIAKTIPQLSHMRTVNASLASSLTAISEHAQVNGAASADAGRKIRALKNKLGGWRMEWDSAEKSRIRIERWEAGLPDDDGTMTPSRFGGVCKRIDGRVVVQEQLEAFKLAIANASMKTQAIMARG